MLLLIYILIATYSLHLARPDGSQNDPSINIYLPRTCRRRWSGTRRCSSRWTKPGGSSSRSSPATRMPASYTGTGSSKIIASKYLRTLYSSIHILQSMYITIYQSIYKFLSIYMFIYEFICLPIYLSIYQGDWRRWIRDGTIWKPRALPLGGYFISKTQTSQDSCYGFCQCKGISYGILYTFFDKESVIFWRILVCIFIW